MARLTIKTIFSLDPAEVATMTAEQLRSVNKSLRDAANKRLTSLENRRYNGGSLSDYSLAVRAAESGGRLQDGRFVSAKATTRAGLLREFSAVRDFMRAQTSTVRGVRNYIRNVRAEAPDVTDTPERLRKFLDALNKFRKERPDIEKYNAMQHISEVYEQDMTADEIAQRAADYADDHNEFQYEDQTWSAILDRFASDDDSGSTFGRRR